MIFVTVGSSTIPFDRLLRAIDRLDVDEEIVVQRGASRIRPRRAGCVDFLEFDEFVELVRSARVVVTHGGVGSIMVSLGEQRHPLVVPRRRAHGEAVDDHQVPFARRAHELGLVTLVNDVDDLEHAIADHPSEGTALSPLQSPIEAELRSYIVECVGAMPSLAKGQRQTGWS
jgi:UDP-N-acetylglucosamine transferase subunit ALG13